MASIVVQLHVVCCESEASGVRKSEVWVIDIPYTA